MRPVGAAAAPWHWHGQAAGACDEVRELFGVMGFECLEPVEFTQVGGHTQPRDADCAAAIIRYRCSWADWRVEWIRSL